MKKNNLIAGIIMLLAVPLAAQEYGLVLSGGGGKGAYEVGVWKALTDYGIAQKVTEISGTSVGGLNAALFACLTADEAENIWKTKVPRMLTVSDGSLRESLISQTGLDELIKSIPLQKIQTATYPRITVTAVQTKFKLFKMLLKPKPGAHATRFCLNEESDSAELQKKLLATAAFPVVCNPVKLKDGNEYSDGGEEKAGGDNTPIDPVVQNAAIKTVIVVYLKDGVHLDRRVRQIDYPTVQLIEIIPSIDLGSLFEGTVNFTAQRIGLLIRQGYNDTVTILKNLGYNPVAPYWYEEPATQNDAAENIYSAASTELP